jgi:hypothetical protein
MQIRDPNYDDKVNISNALYFDQVFRAREGDDCYEQNGLPFTLACNDGDTVGWAAFSGFAVRLRLCIFSFCVPAS